MTHFRKYLLLAISIGLIGAGCQEDPQRGNAPILSETPILVSADEAAAAPNEPVPQSIMAMPCLQFKNSDGFLKWLYAYRQGENVDALKMAMNINLPETPEPQLIEALKMSQTEGAFQTSLCNIHKALGIFTWAVEFPNETKIYTYRKPNSESLSVIIPSNTKGEQAYTTTTDLTKLGLPVCLPKTITQNELIWFCGTPHDNWKEVHVNRKLGNMVQLSCEIKKNGEDVMQGLGCLDPNLE